MIHSEKEFLSCFGGDDQFVGPHAKNVSQDLKPAKANNQEQGVMSKGILAKKMFPVIAASEELGVLTLQHLWGELYGLRLNSRNPLGNLASFDPAPWRNAVKSALQEAVARNAKEVMFRLIKDEHTIHLSKVVQALGFTKKMDRVEFKSPIERLPDDSGSPLTWKTAEQLGMLPKDIAHQLMRVAVGDPGHDPSEDPLLFIQDFLHDPVLTAGLGCIHFGFLQGKIAAMTVVQINPQSGWARISYMGVTPDFRRQGLGKWVHRFSFAQMRREGGKLYRGGTAANNHAMIGLFKMHQCELFQEMEEWIYSVHRGER